MAQSCSTCGSITSYTVDLSANPDTSWTVSSSRSGQCCQGSGSDKCIVFYITVSPKASEIKFTYKNGSANNGSYEINCDPATNRAPGNSQCLGGILTFCLTYCSPGNANDPYTISTSSGFTAGPDITLRNGCTGRLTVSGLAESSLNWTSVYPGAVGAYNSYLSCTASCDTTNITPGAGAPSYVDYKVCGSRTGCLTGNYCDTQRVYMVTPLTVSVTPSNPVICTGDPNPVLTANATGGSPPYSYSWSTGATTQSITAPAGSYTVSVSDTASSCASIQASATVTSQPAGTVNAGADAIVCSGSNYQLAGSRGGSATSSAWTTSGTGTFDSAALLAATYIPSAADISSGAVTLTLTASGPCSPVNDAMVLSINPAATVNAGADATICSGSTYTLSGSRGGGATTSTWTTTGTGTFSNATLLNPVYTPSAADITAGAVTLTLTTNDPAGPCSSASDAMVLTINPAATVNAGLDAIVCSGNSYTLSGLYGGSATSSSWTSSGTGTFDNNALLTAQYTPSAADITSGSVTLTLTTNDPAGVCPAVNDAMVLAINLAATVNAGSDAVICSGNTYSLSGARGGSATSSLWTTSGTGSFNDATLLTAVYTPSAADITAGAVTLTLTTNDPAGPCLAATDAMVLTINPLATVNAGLDAIVCSGNSYALSGLYGGSATSSSWTSSGTGTFDNNALLNAQYTPSAADITSGSVTLTLTTNDPAGVCPAVNDAMVLAINPAATVNAGSDAVICSGNTYSLSGVRGGSATSSLWTTSGTGSFNDATLLTAVYTPSAADITAGAVTLTLTTNDPAGICPAVSDAMNITITPGPTANAGADQTVCANNANVTLNGSVTIASGGTWTSSGSGTFSPNNNTLAATYIPSAADKSAGSITLTLTTTGNGTCTAASDIMSVVITPAPTVNAGADKTVCANNATVVLNGSVTVATGASWSSSGSGNFSPNNNTLNATYTPSAADKAAGTVTLTLITTGNGTCTAVSDSMIITITPAPTVNAGTDQTVCANNAIVNLNGNVTIASGGSWTTSGSGTFSPNNTVLTATYTPSAADKSAGTVTLTLTTTGNGSCTAVSDAMILTITPAPVANAGIDQNICFGSSVVLNGAVTVASGGSWSGGSGIFTPDSTTLNAIYTPSASEQSAGAVTLTLVTTGNGNCISVSDNMTVVITGTITTNAGADKTVCANNASISLSGLVSGGTTTGHWTTSGTGTFSPNANTINATYIPSAADKAAGSGTLTLTSTNNGGCTAVSDAMNFTITPAPTSNAGVDQTVCANNGNAVLNGSVTIASGGSWTTSGSGIFSPGNTTLNASYLPSAGDTASGSVTLTLTTTGNGNCLAVNDAMSITISDAPVVNAGSDRSVCINNPNVLLNGTSSTGSGSWSSTGNGIFTPNSTTLNATYVPDSTDLATGSVTLTLTSAGNGTCLPVSDAVNIIFTSVFTVDAGPDVTVCANNSSVNLNGLSGTGSGQWSTSGTGIFSPGAGMLSTTYIPGNADTAAGTVMLTLTTTNNGSCLAVTDQLEVNITTSPAANAGPDQIVCANNADVMLNGSVSVATGGIWSTSGSGIFSPDNQTLNAIYIPSAADKSAGTISLTLTTAGNGLCNAVSDSMMVTVSPAPTANAGTDRTVCKNNPNVSLNGSVTIASGGTWSSSGDGLFSHNNATLNAMYIPGSADTTSGSVTLILTTTGNGNCLAAQDTMTITISPPPIVYAGANQSVCANNASVSLNGTSSTGFGLWTSSGTGYFSPNNSTLSTTYNPSAADTAAGTVTLTLASANNGGCNPVTSQMTITITDAPTVNAGSDQSVCSNNALVTLSGVYSSPASGAVWTTSGSGTFSPGNTFMNAVYTPSNADTAIGSIIIYLTTTGNGLCNSVTDSVTVNYTNAPIVNAGSDANVCIANPDYVLNGYSSTGSGTWTTLGTGIFSPNNTTLNATYIPGASDTASRSVTLVFTSANNGSCNSISDTMTIIYTDLPGVNAGSDQTVCANNAAVLLNGSSTTGTGFWTTNGTGAFSPNSSTLNATYNPGVADTAAGNVLLTLTSTNGCAPVSQSIAITITDAPAVNAGADQFICSNNPGIVLNGMVSGGASTGIWSTNGSGSFSPDDTSFNATYTPTPADVASGSLYFILSSTGNGNCALVKDSAFITFTPSPLVNAGSDIYICNGSNAASLSGSVTGGASTGRWTTDGTGTFSPDENNLNAIYNLSAADTAIGTVTLILTSTNNGNCLEASDTVLISVTAPPVTFAGNDFIVCANNSDVQLSGSIISSTGTGQWTSGGSGIFIPGDSVLNAVYQPSAADLSAGSVILFLTPTNACLHIPDSLTVTFTPAPAVNAGSDIFICSGTMTAALNGSISGGASKGKWTTLGSGTFFPNDSTLNASYNLSSTDSTMGSIQLILTSSDNGNCFAVSDTLTIAITSIPTSHAGNDTAVCAGASSIQLNGSIIGGSGTGQWITNGSGTFTPDNTTLNAAYSPGPADITSGFVTLILTSTNSCLNSTDTMVVTITPAPVSDAGIDQAICSGDSVNLVGSVTTASGGKWATTGTGTFIPDDSSLIVTYVPGSGDIAGGSVSLILTTTGNGNCSAAYDTMTITISSSVAVVSGNDTVVCAGSGSIQLSGSLNGTGSIQWTSNGDGTFSPNASTLNAIYQPGSADTLAGSVTLILSAANTCFNSSDTTTITFIPTPTSNAGADQMICAGDSVHLNGAVNGSGSCQWITTGSGTFIPNDSIPGAVYVPSVNDISVGSITLSLTTTGNGNCSAAADTMVITISSAIVAFSGNDTVVCAGSGIVQLSGSITGTGSIQWTTNGDGTFSPNASTLNAIYQPGTADTLAGSVMLILSAANTCFNSSDTTTITFIPTPTSNAGADQMICAGDSVHLNGAVNGSGSCQWITTGSGTFIPNDSTTGAVYVPSVNDISGGSITLSLITTGNGNCSAASDTMVITISSAIVAFSGNDTVVCAGSGSIQLSGSLNGTGAIQWTSNGDGTFSPNASTLNAIYQPGSADTLAGSVSLILSAANTCFNSSDTTTITFIPTPTSNAGADQMICAGDSVHLNGAINNSGSCQWITTGSGTFIPNDSTPGAVYVPSVSDISGGSVSLSLTTTGNGNCSSASDTMVITISSAIVAFSGNDTVACAGNGSIQLNGTSNGNGITQWTTSGNGSFSPDASTLNAIYQPGSTDTLNGSVTLILSAANSCFNSSDTTIITFIPTPTSNAGVDQTICKGDSIHLSGSVTAATGHQWLSTGTGFFSPDDTTLNAFYVPGIADVSAGNVTLILTSSNACKSVSDSLVIAILQGTSSNAGSDQFVCEGMTIQLNGLITPASGGQWISSGNGVFLPDDTSLNVVYVPGAADLLAGSVNIILTPSGSNNCPALNDTMAIIIRPKPIADFTNSTPCVNSTTDFTDATSQLNGIITGWSWNFGADSSVQQDPAVSFSNAGMQTVTFIATATTGCSDTVVRDIFVNPIPVAAFIFHTACPDSAEFTDASTISSGSIAAWNWNFGDFASISEQNPLHVFPTNGNYAVTLTVLSDSGCAAMFTDSVTVDACDDNVFNAPAVPTAFTPNNDGHNDILFVRGGPFNEFDFRVYNEWGNEIFRSNVQSAGWDGTFKSKPQPGGKYIWTVNGTSLNNSPVRLMGEVMLIRK